MPITQKFIYTWPDGSNQIEMIDWLKTLPASDQDEYWEGRRNGDRLRQIAIDEGRMILKDNAYMWRDAESLAVNKENDPIWEKYWLRWQHETGVIFSIETIEE
jgi:hypothetical protein